MTFFKPNHKLFKISLTKIKTPNGDVFYFLFLLYSIFSSSLYSSTETALTCFHVTNLLTPTNPNQSNSSPDHFLLSHWSKPSKSPLPESSSTTHFFFLPNFPKLTPTALFTTTHTLKTAFLLYCSNQNPIIQNQNQNQNQNQPNGFKTCLSAMQIRVLTIFPHRDPNVVVYASVFLFFFLRFQSSLPQSHLCKFLTYSIANSVFVSVLRVLVFLFGCSEN